VTVKQRVLKVLADGRWHTAVELCQPQVGGIAFNQRLGELRRAGFEIECERVPGKPYFRYRLLTPPVRIDFEKCCLKPLSSERQLQLV